ncbi:hypothetical protein UAY_01845 [Enterococcus moraviensis ATCC BAA-383]|uniref:HTH tetR-type domain-containing protein n=1 Tax=Enterococcus moraviensis ATCC BAA-383 TaxID=1158609 RepID=R2TKW2_9ENTE|nr:TetR/AcrR family transcriptional regulator [Enterococcus moraviensis]EOI00742.1 hypothetical protein UAY_01845 [Enterococcus moraviensis ATCC BAA-383]EOT73029.1 hypothetical protein I586_00022 [Enterococcus moraviensis ATCC BAA-383]OJG64764.1 hypothetical protein RV09_GL001382 [Enterococcus moraviensis]
MSRNKNPEVTIEKILVISENLFQTKGYDKTTIHDIIRELGMSKGAIYYHFTSKEEILEAVIQKQFKNSHDDLIKMIGTIEAENAKEKLIKLMNLIEQRTSKTRVTAVQEVMINQANNPQFVISGMQIAVQQEAPLFAEIIKEGIQDGSLETEYPNECAEMFLLLINLWCSPFVFESSLEQVKSRLLFLRHNMQLLGLDIISDQLISDLIGFYQEIYDEHEMVEK